MASNSELSEIKLLLQSLAPGLKAAKSDVAELKKSQSQSQQSNSTCANAQTPALIRDTETAVLQLVEEEKVLIHAEVVQLSNCARCTSLNVDYDTGKPAKREMGSVLKKLMKDRRVDPGMKWSPVFGRYAFVGESVSVSVSEGEVWKQEGEEGQEGAEAWRREKEEQEMWISVGDEVQVTRRNEERTVMDWPF
ncbi:hypothetical protein B0T09DRAFT_405546 [Sordaria sp. MPI-SDFR-AT-0083]|nr:hypothetical protein B0T09DRAFT_405546 [Sordaria sp. MPI-SDFR-AT-0083]